MPWLDQASCQRLAGGVEHHAASAPLEQLEAQLPLESADLLAHGAVRQMQHIGCRTQVL